MANNSKVKILDEDASGKGFTRGEGFALYVLSAIQLIAVVILFLILWNLGHFIIGLAMLILYIVAQIGFLGLYQKRICVSCQNKCPFNPNISFWKTKEVEE
jgi:type IV secretory pathway VirB3-like protein